MKKEDIVEKQKEKNMILKELKKKVKENTNKDINEDKRRS